MKRFLILFSILFLASCSKQVNEIPLIVYDYNDLYIQDFQTLIMETNDSSYTYKSYDSKNSQIIQNEIIESVLDGDYPLLVVNPVDRLGVYPLIEKAKKTNMPIIFINREPLKKDLDLWDKVYYVGAKAEQSAELQAEIVMDLFGGVPDALNHFDKNNDNKIQAVILKGQPGHQDAEIRTNAVIDFLEDAGYDLDVLTITEAYFSKDRAKEEMNDIIETYGDQIEIVISNNDAMALGAIESLVEHEYFIDTNEDGIINRNEETWLPVIGIDGIPSAVSLIETGYLYGTVLNDSEEMAKALNELVKAIIENKDLSTINYTIEDGTYIWIDYQKFTE